jgi:hypothetical protein
MNDLRHYCRNPRCKMKLAEPVSNDHHAFCTPGCHTQFYRKRCLVCERPFAEVDEGRSALVGARPIRRLETRRFCCPKCAAVYRQSPEIYRFRARTPGAHAVASETPVKWAFKGGPKSGWRWEATEDEHRLLDRDGEMVAGFVPAQTGYRVFHPVAVPLQQADTLEGAKRLAISLALARLPLDQRTADRIAKANELPETLPQNLMAQTERYLAGLAQVWANTSPSIVPDEANPAIDDEIPAFLVRTHEEIEC